MSRAALAAVVLATVLLTATARVHAQETPMVMPDVPDVLVLPSTSDPEIDRLLQRLETSYADMDVDRWVALFTEDFEQIDVPRRVHVVGRAAWRRQTERINALHTRMGRIHHGRARVGDWIVVEIEWTGTVRGAALGQPGHDRDYRYLGLALLEVAGGRVRRQIIYGDVTTLNEMLAGKTDGPGR